MKAALVSTLTTFLMTALATAAPQCGDSYLFRDSNWLDVPSRPGVKVARFGHEYITYETWKFYGTIASFETQADEDHLSQLLPPLSGTLGRTFIGLYRQDDTSPWIWETGVPLNYTIDGFCCEEPGDYVVAGYFQGSSKVYEATTGADFLTYCLIEVDPFVDCDGDGEHDDYQVYLDCESDWNGDGYVDACQEQGTVYCGSGQPNSTGQLGGIRALGRTQVAANDLTLFATRLPPGKFGYWLASASADFIPGFGGSMGTLCLGPPQIRFNAHPKYGVWSVPSNGRVGTTLDLTDIPQVGAIQAGETWHFQAWHRDFVGGAPTSNTTDALLITFV